MYKENESPTAEDMADVSDDQSSESKNDDDAEEETVVDADFEEVEPDKKDD